MEISFYRCSQCGNIAVKPYDTGAPLACCGKKMEKLDANSVDAATEKHVPVIERDGQSVRVQIGSVVHPMSEEHLIAFICLVTEKGFQIVELSAADEPATEFALAKGDTLLEVYEYCNLHGLWVAQA